MRPFVYSVIVTICFAVCLATGLAKADEKSAAPAAVDPLPSGWEAGKFDTGAIHTGRCEATQSNFELNSESRTAYGNISLADWAKLSKEREAKESGLSNRKETDLKSAKIGDRDVLEYEITGNLGDLQYHYRVYLVQVRDVFCRLSVWSSPSHWDAAQAKFDDLAANLK